jgi:predicted RNA-binding Zn-ribbon protein involved in translation (DUF1610 family)
MKCAVFPGGCVDGFLRAVDVGIVGWITLLIQKQRRIDTTKMKSLKISLLLGAVLAAMNLTAFAGPGMPQVFEPLNSKAEISALTPGTMVAHECPHCGTIAVSKVGDDKSHAESHTCPVCKMKITYRESGSGKAPATRMIACVDEKTGKEMSARVCAAHE